MVNIIMIINKKRMEDILNKLNCNKLIKLIKRFNLIKQMKDKVKNITEEKTKMMKIVNNKVKKEAEDIIEEKIMKIRKNMDKEKSILKERIKMIRVKNDHLEERKTILIKITNKIINQILKQIKILFRKKFKNIEKLMELIRIKIDQIKFCLRLIYNIFVLNYF